MKVLLLATDVFSKGGIPRYTRYQIRALRELLDNKNAFVFSLCSKNEFSFEDDLDVEYEGCGLALKSKMLFVWKAINFVRRNKIDLMICNHIQLTPIALICKKLFGTKYLMNAYGIEIWSGLGKKEILGLNNANGVLGDCKFILDYIQNNIDNKKNKYLLYDCVDTDRFKPMDVPEEVYKKYNIPKSSFKILTVAALYRYKGHELVIEALSQKKLRNKDVIYIIAGDGPKRNYLKNLVKEKKLEGKVLFLGRVPESDLVYLYNIADIFALISKFGKGEGEGLPLALLEASACSKPIIAGNQDGSREAVKEGVNGYCIDPHDINGLSSLIIKILDNPNEKIVLGNEGRKRILKRFSYESFREKIRSILVNTY